MAALVLVASGCAFEDGRPWAVAQFDVTLSHEGDIAAVEIAGVELEMDVEGTVPAADDHGHDHGGAAEADPAEGVYVLTAIPHGPIEPTTAGARLEIEECTDDCRLPRGELREVRLLIEAVTLADGEELELDAEVHAEVEGVVDRDHPGGVRIAVAYTLPADLAEVTTGPLEVDVEVVGLDEIERLDHEHHE